MKKQNKYAVGCVKGPNYHDVKWYQMDEGDFFSEFIVIVSIIVLIPALIISLHAKDIWMVLGDLIFAILPVSLFIRSHRKAEREAIRRNKKLSDSYVAASRWNERENEKIEMMRKIANNR